jgi:hypothetical protein
MGLGILTTLIFLHLPFALVTIAGERACRWTSLLGTLYFTSQTVWSFFIALYRVLYIKFQNLFKTGIKETTFVFFLSNVGILYIALSGAFFAFYERGMVYKLCTHYSIQQIEIFDVSYFLILFFFANAYNVFLNCWSTWITKGAPTSSITSPIIISFSINDTWNNCTPYNRLICNTHHQN